jgi:hypothetical protein
MGSSAQSASCPPDGPINAVGLITTDAIARVILLGAAWRIAAYKTMYVPPNRTGDTIKHSTILSPILPFPPGPIGVTAVQGDRNHTEEAFRELANDFEQWMEEVDRIRMEIYESEFHEAILKTIMARADEIILCSLRITITGGVMSLQEATQILFFQDTKDKLSPERKLIERLCDNIIIASDAMLARPEVSYVGSGNKTRSKDGGLSAAQYKREVDAAWGTHGGEYEVGPVRPILAGIGSIASSDSSDGGDAADLEFSDDDDFMPN